MREREGGGWERQGVYDYSIFLLIGSFWLLFFLLFVGEGGQVFPCFFSLFPFLALLFWGWGVVLFKFGNDLHWHVNYSEY